MHLSNKLSALKPSETLAISAQARSLQEAGRDVIALAAGEPDFPPPAHIREAVAREALQGVTRYGPAGGSLEARRVLGAYLESTRGGTWEPDQVVLTNGGKHALYDALAGVIDPGDEAIILSPYWVTYPAQVELLGGVSRFIAAGDEAGFKISPDQLRRAIGPRTRCLIFNNPSNPTGAFYTADEVRALTRVCVEAGIAIVSDEVYDAILYDGSPYLSPASVSPEAAALTVIIGSLSKTYAMPGWRIGFLAGPLEWTRKVASFQGQITHHPSALAQAAAMAAYSGPQDAVEEMRRAFLARRTFLLEAFADMPGFELKSIPQGAFYLFPRVTALIDALDEVHNDAEACSWLLDASGVALVPGSAFGAEGYLRLSYAASMEELEQAVTRIREAVRFIG